jgi:hypothetical protein
MSELIYDDEDGSLDQRIRTNRGQAGKRRAIPEVEYRREEGRTEEEARVEAVLKALVARQAAGGLNAGVEVELEL